MISLKKRLSFIHGREVNDEEAVDLLEGGLLSESTKLAIEDVGWLNLKQLGEMREEHFHNFNPKRCFSSYELSQVIPISHIILDELIDFPSIVINDKILGEHLAFKQMNCCYIYNGRIEKTDADEIRSAGYNLSIFKISSDNINILNPNNEFLEHSTSIFIPLLKEKLKALPSLPIFYDKRGCRRNFLPGRIDVWFREVSESRINDVLRQAKLKILPQKTSERKHGLWRTKIINDYKVSVLRVMSNALKTLTAFDEVLFAEPDEISEGDFGPAASVDAKVNDREFLYSNSAWNNELIQMKDVHTITRGSKKVTIFVIDSGIDLTHPDIQPALRSDWKELDLNFDFEASSEEISPAEETISHGTSVSSLIIGQGNEGVHGVAPQCSLVPLKINGGSYAAGYGLRAAAILQALEILKPGERGIINISWKTSGEHIGIREALKRCREKDVPVVLAAGNYGRMESTTANQILYPAAYTHQYPKLENLLSVGAINAEGKRAWYSYYGNDSITVAAPGGEEGGIGVGIHAAKIGGNYHYVFGTSFAAPQVSGLIALLLSLNPNMSATEAVNRVKQSVKPLESGDLLGSGLISVVDTIRNGSGPRIEPIPRPTENKVNINVANLQELESIKGITNWEAQGIIKYRDENGPYKTIWDLIFTERVEFYTILIIQDKICV